MLRSCLLFPLVLALAHSACVLEVDDENIFLSRMPGTWEIDIDMSEALAPSTYQSFNVAELTITRNDSNIESFYGEECDEGDFTLHMTGFAETTNFQRNETTVYDFAVSTYKGNPVITYLVPELDYEPAFAYCMLATGENTQDDILFIRDNHSGEGMITYRRQETLDYDF